MLDTLKISNTFTNMKDVCSALNCYSDKSSSPYKFRTNKPIKLLAICPTNKNSSCPFTVSANKCKDSFIHIIKLIPHNPIYSTLMKSFKACGSSCEVYCDIG
ncbi:hypothetical protein F8M41_001412 [Gigaspora margarita]|uniref:Uncharacterized protein n=1 Tax=Gigaspora margarita TaxID=4874 RepID=A0A8H3XFX0_GIGMA|nr:hypothetical protein F8M41_001412 [Gigaspora margarita]